MPSSAKADVSAFPRLLSIITAALIISLYGAVSPVFAANPTPSTAPAASATGVTISPSIKQLVISSGLVEANDPIVLSNHTTKDLTVSVRMVDFQSLSDAGDISFGQAGLALDKYGLANWMTLPGGNSVPLASGESKTVPVTIQNRADLAPGGHYGAIVFTVSSAAGSASGNVVNFKQELVSLVFLNKLGGEHYGLALESLSAKAGNSIPTTASVRFRSTGNVYVVPRGYITVTAPDGTLLAKGFINPESGLILPGAERTFVSTLQPISGSNILRRYKVTAYYRSDQQTTFSSKTIYVTNGPLSPLTLIIAALTGVILLMVLHKSQRKIRKKHVKHSRKNRKA